jgi:Ca2+-transporting ATPase
MVLNSDVSEKEGGDWHGDSTEIALVDYALTKTKWKENQNSHFILSRKCMTTIHQTEKEYYYQGSKYY